WSRCALYAAAISTMMHFTVRRETSTTTHTSRLFTLKSLDARVVISKSRSRMGTTGSTLGQRRQRSSAESARATTGGPAEESGQHKLRVGNRGLFWEAAG